MAVWLKRGAAAAKALADAEKEAQIRAEQNQKTHRFWVPAGQEARFTFVDGFLTPENTVDFIALKEHALFMNGKYHNYFSCLDTGGPEGQVCPLCVGGDTAYFAGAFTVIDHRAYKNEKTGKVFTNQRRLFVAKRETIKLLQQLGIKRGGLAGCTFDAMRSGDKSPGVGNSFDFIEKNSIEDLKKKFMVLDANGKPFDVFSPLDYEKEFTLLTKEEMLARGFGPPPTSNAAAVNYATQGASAPSEETQQAYKEQL